MKKTAKVLIFVLLLALFAMPLVSFAKGSLVPCGVTDEEVLAENPEYAKPCDFNKFMTLVNNVLKFVLFKLAMPIAAIMFAWAGFLMVTAGGSTERVGKAKRIFTNVAIGFIIAVIAWLIVRTILAILGFDGDWIGF